MRTLAKLTWVELKLFVREPITMVFTLALPLIFLVVMGEVFGNTPDPEGEVYRGIGPMNYYAPAYIGLVISAIGVIGLPVHLAGYREKGILRRLRASSLSAWSVLGSQALVSFVIALLGGLLLLAVSLIIYNIDLPRAPALVVAAFILSVLSFTAVGVLLGAILPTTRSAQGVGLPLFFVMLILSGAGPPREVMTEVMQWVANVLPLTHTILLLQDSWNGFGWNMIESLIVAGITVAAAGLSIWLFRWE